VASGLEGVFSKGMIIGKIISIKKNKPFAFQDVLVRPMVEFGKLEEVFVVMDK
jgi:rod shape-determining protein MreC